MYLNYTYELSSGLTLNNWTLTWDVFKLLSFTLCFMFSLYWTLTWDVFKYKSILIYSFFIFYWTLTWDVFKFA